MNAPDPYEVLLHKETPADLGSIPRNMTDRILLAMEERLARDPVAYGERLRQSLRGFWKMRVGDYRVIYGIAGREVRVYGVLHRRGAYDRILRRTARGWGSRPSRGG